MTPLDKPPRACYNKAIIKTKEFLMRKKLHLICALAVGALVVGGCGQSDTPTAGASASSPSAVSDDVVTLPELGETTIGYDAYRNREDLIHVVIRDGVTAIDYGAFSYCLNLESVVIPDSVTEIGNYAFSSCQRLESVVIPNNITTIGDGLFSLCYGLVNVVIPYGVTTIGEKAFFRCRSLKTIVIPYGITSVGNEAFRQCENLNKITIGDNVPIHSDTFAECLGNFNIIYAVTGLSAGTYKFTEDKWVYSPNEGWWLSH
jgi:hypothetical protein